MTVIPQAVSESMQRKRSDTHLVDYWGLNVRAAVTSPTKIGKYRQSRRAASSRTSYKRGKRRQLVSKVLQPLLYTVISRFSSLCCINYLLYCFPHNLEEKEPIFREANPETPKEKKKPTSVNLICISDQYLLVPVRLTVNVLYQGKLWTGMRILNVTKLDILAKHFKTQKPNTMLSEVRLII